MEWPDRITVYSEGTKRSQVALTRLPNVTQLQRSYVNEEIFMEMVEEKAAKETLLEHSEQILNNETRKVDIMDKEIQALRSVLSEETMMANRECYSQWFVAEELRAERETWYQDETFGEVKTDDVRSADQEV